MKTVSIGFTREDGDFQLLATLNNNDDLLDEHHFKVLVRNTLEYYNLMLNESCQALHRQDAPDYLILDEEA